jgi:hypothetical protein
MDGTPAPGGNRAGVAVLVLVPVVLAVGVGVARTWWGARSAATASPVVGAPPAAGGLPVDRGPLVPLDRWPDGKPRVTARDWTEGEATLEELCHFDVTGVALGCGTLRDGQPWDGVHVAWHAPVGGGTDGPSRPSRVGTYRNGVRHGSWKTYRADGTLLMEVSYRDGVPQVGVAERRDGGGAP